MSALQKKMSYLRARDPSLPVFTNFKLQPQILPEESMSDEDNFDKFDEEDEEEEPGKLDVYLRFKYTGHEDNLYSITENTLTCHVPESSQSGRNVKDGELLSQIYSFTKIFPANSTQIELFDNVVKRKILRCMNGKNSNLLTYGPSGSGKTFTIVGTREEPGMLPQSLEYLFRSMKNLKKYPVAKPKSGHMSISWLNQEERQIEVNELQRLLSMSDIQPEIEQHIRTYSEMQKRLSKESVALLDELGSNLSIWISFAEIYNESVYDLLATSNHNCKSRKKLKIYNNNGETYIKDLKQVYVSNGHDAYCILQYGLLNLNYAATSLNSHSSRSHCIFTISLVQSTETESGNYLISRINFCDLAGSERSKKTNNVGCRLNESNNINTSLLVLGRCISSIRKAQKTGAKIVIPFRESKLTQLFQKALQGEQDISMVVAINPDRYVFDETIHALNFSAIAKEITLDKVGDSNYGTTRSTFTEFSAGDYERQIDALQYQVQELTAELNEERMQQDHRENNLRQSLIEQFKKMYDDMKEQERVRMEIEIDEKDEIIESLQEELEKYTENTEDPDVSVISIASSIDENNTSMKEKIANSSIATKRYNELFDECEAVKQEKCLLEMKVDEVQKRIDSCLKIIASQDEMLKKQKMDIIKLQEENALLDQQVVQSIRYSNIIVRDFEEDNSSETYSDDLSS